MLTLGIESSCDETSVAVVDNGKRILANVILSQGVHSKFGGVIPEVASREHIKTIVPIYREALEEAKVSLSEIELIGATQGPGLVGPLLVGLSFAKGLAYAAGCPFVPVNHLEGHIAAPILEHDVEPRHLSLIVSGGHTLLVLVKSFADYDILGTTRDDAAGEAFDKVAKLMGLGYPGGAKIDQLSKKGNAEFVKFPRSMPKGTYSFSFSGLKTAVALYLDKLSIAERDENLANIAASFQQAVIDVLVERTIRASREFDVADVTLTGGVAANSSLRTQLEENLKVIGKKLFYPSPKLCTDNAAMIASAAFKRFELFGRAELIANAIPYLQLG